MKKLRIWIQAIDWRELGEQLKHGGIQLFIAIDQLLNVLSNPFSKQTWADETLSSRCGRLGYRNPYKFWKVVIDALFFWQGPNHCVNAFEKEKTRYHSPPEIRSAVPSRLTAPSTTPPLIQQPNHED